MAKSEQTQPVDPNTPAPQVPNGTEPGQVPADSSTPATGMTQEEALRREGLAETDNR